MSDSPSVRTRARRDVPVRDRDAAQEIAHAAAHEVGQMPPLAQRARAVEERRGNELGIEGT